MVLYITAPPAIVALFLIVVALALAYELWRVLTPYFKVRKEKLTRTEPAGPLDNRTRAQNTAKALAEKVRIAGSGNGTSTANVEASAVGDKIHPSVNIPPSIVGGNAKSETAPIHPAPRTADNSPIVVTEEAMVADSDYRRPANYVIALRAPGLEAVLWGISAQLTKLIKVETAMSGTFTSLDQALQDLTQKVQANTSAEDSAITLLNAIPQMIQQAIAQGQQAGATPEQLQALSDLSSALANKANDLANAVMAGTPQQPSPAPTPAPAPTPDPAPAPAPTPDPSPTPAPPAPAPTPAPVPPADEPPQP